MRSILVLAAFVNLSFLLSAGPGVAATVTNQRPLLFAFDGSNATAGRFTRPGSIAIDNATGSVYVANDYQQANGIPGFVSKFNPDGTPASFAPGGASSLLGPADSPFINLLGLAVDNSGVNPGRLLVSQYGDSKVRAFDSTGNLLWTIGPISGQFGDVAVDFSGHPWTTPDHSPNPGVQQYNTTGAPPAPISSFPINGAKAIDVDVNGNVYLGRSGGIERWVGGALDSSLDPSAFEVYADQSSAAGHIFTVAAADFQEYDSAGALLGTYGSDYVRGAFNNTSVAYNSALDRVYVAQQATFSDPSPVVAAFGAPTSGTVPDLTIDPPSGVGVGSAHFSGTVDPQGQSGTYRFEWKRTDTSWAAADVASVPSYIAGSSPPQPLSAGPGPSPVSFDANALRGGTAYEARLVTVNDTDELRSVSASQGFTTATAPAPPQVTIEVTDTTTTTATVNASVDPEGDFADWKMQRNTNPDCPSGAGNFFDIAGVSGTIPPSIGRVALPPLQLSGLLPSDRNCVRIIATNSAGTTTSPPQPVETDPIPPTGAQTAFAAPRTDTTARLNGRVNPQGHAPLTYHFEYSADDGATWTPLPDQTDTSEARRPITVSAELTGLSPDTTYRYRFFASNEAGPASPQGEEKTFTTRPTPVEPTCANEQVRANQRSSYLPDCRAFELINNPDKGNQFVGLASDTPPSEDGNAVLWDVAGGAPGSNTGTGSWFVAERSAEGWRSTGLAPPADEQVGGGSWGYSPAEPGIATPDYSRFVFAANGDGTGSAVRLDRAQHEEILRDYPNGFSWPHNDDLTDDGAHVVVINPDTEQLEDIGTPGEPEVLSIMPDGTESSCGLKGGRSFLGYQSPHPQWRPGYHLIATTDASRVYFQVPPNGNCTGLFGLWVRNRESEQTTLIDPGAAGRGPELIRATPDGRGAFFVTHSALEPADGNDDADLYRWDEDPDDPAQGSRTCVTCEAAADVNLLGRVLVSDDFSHFYFRSQRALAPGGTQGRDNVYALAEGELRFVADATGSGGVGSPLSFLDGARLSADGNVLLFGAPADLGVTTDSFAAQCPAAVGSVPCGGLYRYDDRDQSIECVSCLRGVLTSHLASDFRLSADGSTIAFETAAALVPRDLNGEKDIYRWRDGSARLITDGVTDFPSSVSSTVDLAEPAVASLSADGSSIFFTVTQPGLTGFEADGTSNAYVARVGGGFEPPTPDQHCVEDSCQGPLQPPPADLTPSSSTFIGPGNPPAVFPRSCSRARGRVRIAKRRLRRAHTRRQRRVARTKLRRAKRRLRVCLGGSR